MERPPIGRKIGGIALVGWAVPVADLLDQLVGDLPIMWRSFLCDWDRSLRSRNHPKTTRYNYVLAASQLARYLTGSPAEADEATSDPTMVSRAQVEAFQAWMIETRSASTALNKLHADRDQLRAHHAASLGSIRRLRSHRSTSCAWYMVTRSESCTNGGPCRGRAVRHRRTVDASMPSRPASCSVVYQWPCSSSTFIVPPPVRRLDRQLPNGWAGRRSRRVGRLGIRRAIGCVRRPRAGAARFVVACPRCRVAVGASGSRSPKPVHAVSRASSLVRI
jgi:hypothetical protein